MAGMNTAAAFAMGEANRNEPVKVFDWDKAARLIKERQPTEASAGLSGDWEYTGGSIYSGGKPDLESYTYLASTWATPELDLDGEVIDCWVWAKDMPDWDSKTKWPASALELLK